MNTQLFKKKIDMRDLQRELHQRGELVIPEATRTKAEFKIADALVEVGIRTITGYQLDGREFDAKVLEYPILIEVDGGIHNEPEVRQKDYQKDRQAQIQGFKVLRFTNAEIMKDKKNVVNQIKRCIEYSSRQPRQVMVYPLSISEQLRMWIYKLLHKKNYRFQFDNLFEERLAKIEFKKQEKKA